MSFRNRSLLCLLCGQKTEFNVELLLILLDDFPLSLCESKNLRDALLVVVVLTNFAKVYLLDLLFYLVENLSVQLESTGHVVKFITDHH